jgi:3-deoxy-D-manno-octulosonic-acid transferase
MYLLAAVAISPVALYRIIKHNRYRTGWQQRFGKIIRRDPAKKCIWLHAVSVGEVNASTTLIEELKKTLPNFEIVISTTTDTGFARATALLGRDLQVFYFPFDFSLIMSRAFRNIQPAICLLMELEVWPNFVHIAQQLNIPVIVVNGRLSEKSFSKYKIIKPITKLIFQKVSLVLAQSDEYARRFREIGSPAEKVIVTGSLKYDTAQVADKIEGSDVLAKQLNIRTGEKLFVAGGTGIDEEKIILDAYRELKSQFGNLRLAIVPRKPERFNEVAQLIQQNGLGLTRYSQIKGTSVSADSKTVILGDTMGDLRKFYSLADIIFVGRSLVPMGGSDMMEAAALGKCTLFGPYTFNFKQTVDDLLKNNGAIEVQNSQELLEVMQKCLSNPEYAAQIAHNGQQIILKNQGATRRSSEAIIRILNTR